MNHNGQYQNPASPELWSPTRREFLIRASSAAAIAVGGLAGIPLTAGRAYAATQPDWRFCTNCHGLFFSGANCTYQRDHQRCPAGGLHCPLGANYVLEYDTAIDSRFPAQMGWRFCDKCNGLFYFGPDGSDRRPDQVCPAGGLHNAAGYNYVVGHGSRKSLRGSRIHHQQDWRFCTKCYGLFYWGKDGSYHRENQRCPAGDLHNPATGGYNYVLTYHQLASTVPTPPVQHFIEGLYVLPSDGADAGLAEDGTLTRSVKAMQLWFCDQTCGSRLNIRPEIRTVRLNESDADIAAHGQKVRDHIETLLGGMGFNDPHTMYAVWYDGFSDFRCGGGSWPTGVTESPNQQLPGHVAALYLRAAYDALDANRRTVHVNCANDQFTTDGVTPAINEFKMVHEILHTMGIVHPAAPHHAERGHTGDNPQDLMYAGNQPWDPRFLDPGHDDYFQTRRTDLIDLSRSVFLDPLPPDAQPPPGW